MTATRKRFTGEGLALAVLLLTVRGPESSTRARRAREPSY